MSGPCHHSGNTLRTEPVQVQLTPTAQVLSNQSASWVALTTRTEQTCHSSPPIWRGKDSTNEHIEVNLVSAPWCAHLHCQIGTTTVRHMAKSQNKIIHRRDVYNVRRRSSDSNTAFRLPLLLLLLLLLRVPRLLHLVLLQIPYPLPIKPKTASKWFPVRLSKSVLLLITLQSHP